MKINIKTVAKKAEVSIASVSRVLNNHKGVKDSTRKKVLKAMADLNYEVNAVARGLKLQKTYTIGVVVANILSPFFSEISKAIEEGANKYNYNVILCNSDDESGKELLHLKMLKSYRVDGIILTPTQKNKYYIKKLMNTTKIVIIDRLIDGIECNGVIIDNELGAYAATKHLIDKGYKNIAIINGPPEIFTAKERIEGYLRALKEANISTDKDLIKTGTFQEKSGVELMNSLIDSPQKPDAVFITNLDLTLGALTLLKKRKVRIPKDIAIISFSDHAWAKVSDPPLSVVSFPIEDIGKIAVNMLIDSIDTKEEKVPSVFKIKTHLILRKST